jgi:hypothetical protein
MTLGRAPLARGAGDRAEGALPRRTAPAAADDAARREGAGGVFVSAADERRRTNKELLAGVGVLLCLDGEDEPQQRPLGADDSHGGGSVFEAPQPLPPPLRADGSREASAVAVSATRERRQPPPSTTKALAVPKWVLLLLCVCDDPSVGADLTPAKACIDTGRIAERPS